MSEKINLSLEKPVDLNEFNEKVGNFRRYKLSSIAKANPNFSLSAFSKIHRIQLNNRLMASLERNEIERPKIIE